MTMRILHLSADFPDLIVPDKTRAISTLVDLVADQFEHEVISLNRITPRVGDLAALIVGKGEPLMPAGRADYVLACRYRALPAGLLHRTLLLRLADAVFDEVCRQPRPDLIVAHKLTVEGIVAAELARRLDVPYALILQGDTDTKILAARPDLRRHFAAIFHGAAMVMPLAPWTLEQVELQLGRRAGPVICVPCPIRLDQPIQPVVRSAALVSGFHLRNHRRKNLAGTVAAFRAAQLRDPSLTLRIIGGGDAADFARVGRIVSGHSAITLAGAIPNQAMAQAFNAATAFVMPSLRESFGMVFLEALFCGCPIIYPADRAVDGYFSRRTFAISVDPRDTRAITDAMLRIVQGEVQIKQDLARWQTSGDARQFQRDAIATTFATAVRRAVSGSPATSSRPVPPAAEDFSIVRSSGIRP